MSTFNQRHIFTNISSSMDFDDFERRVRSQFEEFPRQRLFTTTRTTRPNTGRPSHQKDFVTKSTLYKGRPSKVRRLSAKNNQARSYHFTESVDNDLTKGESFFQDVAPENDSTILEMLDDDDGAENVGFVDGFIRSSFGSGKRKPRVQKLKKAVLREDIEAVKRLVELEDVSAKDSYGKTALHLAALVQNLQIVQILLKKRADVAALDNFEDTPLHTAVRTGNKEIIEALLGDDRVRVNYSGSNKVTALHIAARLDKDDSGQICQLLMDRKADIFASDEDDNIPITLAAMKGIEQNMKPMIEHALSSNQKVHRLMYDIDNRGSSLLHVAVRSRDIEAVKICLEYDARIDEARHFDGSTSVHLACIHGQEVILKRLLDQPSTKFDHSIRDKEGNTCLHRAAKAGNCNILNILLNKFLQGSREMINEPDNNNRTPVLLAAARGHSEAIERLLLRGADISVKDDQNKTAFHYAVGHTKAIEQLVWQPRARELLKHQDSTGSTALHVAAMKGNTETASLLLLRVRDLAKLKNNYGQLPLHIAAREGWYEMVQHLLSGSNIGLINSLSKDERTALHMACGQGHTKIVGYLLQKGATLNKDQHGMTPLHLASWSGSLESVQLLLEAKFECLNSEDRMQDTALSLAAQGGHDHIVTYLMSINEQKIKVNSVNKNPLDKAIDRGHENVAMALAEHPRWKEVLRREPRGFGQLEHLIEKMPDVALKFLDKCVQKEGNPTAPDYKVTHDLSFIQGMPDKSVDSPKTSLKPLYCMALNKRHNCLTHPISSTLIRMKWRLYGMNVFLTNQFLAIIYGILVFFLVSSLEDNPCYHQNNDDSANSTVCVPTNLDGDVTWPKLIRNERYQAIEIMLSLLIIITALRHISYIYNLRFRYFLYISYLIEMTQCICMATFLWSSNCTGCYGAGAIAVCLCWLSILMRISWGTFLWIYVTMMFRIFETVFKVFILLFLIIGCFAFSFYVANFDNVLFSNIPQSCISTFMMMLGSLSYNGIFLDDETPLYYPELMYLSFILFCIIMPILFLNLLIGLAVGDTESILKYAAMQSYASQVEQLYDIEQTIPTFILKRWWVDSFDEFPNQSKTWWRKILDFMVSFQLPKEEENKDTDDKDLEQTINRQGQMLDDFSGNLDNHNNQIDGIRMVIGRIGRLLSQMKDNRFTQTDAPPDPSTSPDPPDPRGPRPGQDPRGLRPGSEPGTTTGKKYQYKYVYKIKYGKSP